ncbi:MAG: hypothetical protein ACKPFJ_03915, partial [Dolichospermum sp.]
FFDIPHDIEKKDITVVINTGEFVLFNYNIIHLYILNQSGKLMLSLTLRLTQLGVEILPGYNSIDN